MSFEENDCFDDEVKDPDFKLKENSSDSDSDKIDESSADESDGSTYSCIYPVSFCPPLSSGRLSSHLCGRPSVSHKNYNLGHNF